VPKTLATSYHGETSVRDATRHNRIGESTKSEMDGTRETMQGQPDKKRAAGIGGRTGRGAWKKKRVKAGASYRILKSQARQGWGGLMIIIRPDFWRKIKHKPDLPMRKREIYGDELGGRPGVEQSARKRLDHKSRGEKRRQQPLVCVEERGTSGERPSTTLKKTEGSRNLRRVGELFFYTKEGRKCCRGSRGSMSRESVAGPSAGKGSENEFYKSY